MGNTLAELQSLTRKAQSQVERNRRRAELLIARIERVKRRIAESFYEIGVALNELGQPRLYGSLGYKSLTALLDDRRLLSRSTASELMSIARSFSRAQALALGQAKAIALVRYCDATPAEDVARTLYESDARISASRLSQLSARDLTRATAAIRARHRGRNDPEERAARKAAREMQAQLRRTVSRTLSAEVQRKNGGWWLRIELPVESIGRLTHRK